MKELAKRYLPRPLKNAIKSAMRAAGILPPTPYWGKRGIDAKRVRDVFSLRPPRDFHEREERRAFMRKAFYALSFNGISGDYLEFGSHGGFTFTCAFEESRRANYRSKMWAFDSFQGLPPTSSPEDEHPHWIGGKWSMGLDEFRTACKRSGIPDNEYVCVPGYYDNTIGQEDKITQPMPTDVAFAYIDCDLCSSTKVVLDFLRSRMKHGMIIAFDDYFCYSAKTLSGERLACLEFLRKYRRFHFSPFIQFGWHGMSFVLEDQAFLPTTPPDIA